MRETVAQGIRLTTETFIPSKQRTAAELITVRNESSERRIISLGFDMRARVTLQREKSWLGAGSSEADNKLRASDSHGCMIFEAQHTHAVSVQGISPRPTRIERGRMLAHEIALTPGEARRFHYINVIGEGVESTLDEHHIRDQFRELTRYTTITILPPEKRSAFRFEWAFCLDDKM